MTGMSYVSTTNACKMCTPLGAALAFKGIEGCVPFLHGSQGCATYMRRYVISHFREPIDIASSSLGEKQAVYGGEANLKKGLINVMDKYRPQVIGVATTCLTETIGDDVPRFLAEFRREFFDLPLPVLVQVGTPSYMGTHMDGFHQAVAAVTRQLCREKTPPRQDVNIFPGFVSPADIRRLQAVVQSYGLRAALIPDLSRTMDGEALEDYEVLASGGTSLPDLQAMGSARASVQCGRVLAEHDSAGHDLVRRFAVPLHNVGLPIGLRESDALHQAMEQISGRTMPDALAQERGRLVDAYVDGHKYVSGRRAVVYGEADLVVGMIAFLAEIGVQPVLCLTGERPAGLERVVKEVCADLVSAPKIRTGADFYDLQEEIESLAPDVLVGHSKGYSLARKLDIPLIRVGFPQHDRFGGQRIQHVDYAGTQQLFDRLVNALIEKKQALSEVGYTYL